MENKRFWQGIIILGLVFGMVLLSCNKGASRLDAALNGTWIGIDNNGVSIEIKFQNGNFESSTKSIDTGDVEAKGTYITESGKIIMNTTQSRMIGGEVAQELGIESRWYSNEELILIFKPIFEIYGMSDEEINILVNLTVSPPAGAYSVDGDILTITTTIQGHSSTVTLRKQ